MFSHCSIVTNIQLPNDIDSVAPSANMKALFYENYDLECINKLNTTNATDKTDMFKDCSSLVAPDATDQADLTDSSGANWVNSSSCP
jgi:hypothetical protein